MNNFTHSDTTLAMPKVARPLSLIVAAALAVASIAILIITLLLPWSIGVQVLAFVGAVLAAVSITISVSIFQEEI